jgi:hypothetical protein
MNQLTLRKAAATAKVHSGLPSIPTFTEPLTPPAAPAFAPGKMLKWLLGGILLAPAATMVWATTGAARDCHLKPITLVLGADTQISATVPRGMPCSIRALTGSAMVEDLTIDSPPQHGELTPRGRTGVFYRPDPKFKGEDFFAFGLRGGPSSSRATSIIRVRVTVK